MPKRQGRQTHFSLSPSIIHHSHQTIKRMMVLLLSGNQWSSSWRATTTVSRLFLLLLLVHSIHAWSAHPRSCGGLPKHVHLAVGADPSTEMTVSFASIPSQYDAPVGGVWIGTSPSQLTRIVMEAEAAPSCYNLVAHHGANYGHRYYSPYYHHITISNLQPSTTYYYKPVIHARADDFRLRGSSSSNSNATSSSTMMSSNYYFSNHETLERLQEELEEDYFHRQLSSSSSGRSPPYDGTSKECPSPEKIRSFRTAPPPGSDATVSIAIMGDIGQFPHSEETLARMIRARASIDTVILAGDVAYAGADHKLWDTFFDFMDDYPIAEHFGMQIVPGNHDIDKEPAGDQIFLAYEHRFRMPRVQPAKLGRYRGPTGYMSMDQPPYPMPYEWGNAYYAYTYGPARMIMISSYSAMEPGSTQYEWIVKELQAVDRSITPWVLAVLHTPIYNTFSLHQKDTQILKAREFLEPLFVEYQVNMVFSGHIHAYLRTEKVAVGVNHHKGPMHVTIGAGGRKCEAPFLKEEPEPWVAVRDATVYGYGMFRVFNRTHAEWDWIHTGYSDDRTYNEVKRSNVTLPSVSMDRVVITNQFYSEE